MIRDKPNNTVRIGSDTLGKMIDRVNSHHDSGRLDGLLVVAKLKDGTFECGWSDSVGFAERIGLAECLKADMIRTVSCPFEQGG